MKSNAIVRIVIWSVVIFVLLAVLIAGLANNLFTLFHGNTDTVYHSTDVANSGGSVRFSEHRPVRLRGIANQCLQYAQHPICFCRRTECGRQCGH